MAPLTIQQALQIALQHHQAGQLPQAENLYRQILAQQPKHADALHYLGVIAAQVGQNEIALDLIRQAITIKPNWPDFHNSLGNTLRNMNRLDDAIAAFRQALALKPDYPEALSNLGSALKSNGQLDQAIATFRQVLALKPDVPESHSNLGTALACDGQLDEAIAAFRHAVTLRPNSPEVLSNLGNALKDAGRLDEALAACRQAIALKPNFPEALSNLGIVLANKRQHDEAIATFRQAIALKPDFPEPHSNLGIVLTTKGQLDEAVAACHQAIALRPDYPEAHNSLGNVLRDQGRIDDAIAAYRRALVLKPHFPEACSNLLYAMHFHPAYDLQALAEEHRRWSLQYAAPLKQFVQPHVNDRRPDRRLRIGYLSPDFRRHPAGLLALPLLESHDHDQCCIYCYSTAISRDSITERFQSAADVWREVAGLSDEHLADLIRNDQIDILVDLTMHMANNRLLVFARKPAPVQVTCLTPGTTGLSTMDYRLFDAYVDPLGAPAACYTETTIRLPHCHLCFQAPANSPTVQAPPFIRTGHITFGSLNNFCKTTPQVLDLWSQILQAVPHSRLILRCPSGRTQQRVRNLLNERGIASDRIELSDQRLPPQEYLGLHHRMDIYLDPFPFSGFTTSLDALWMGVPLITLAGQTGVGRGGVVLLSNLGMCECIAQTQEEYVQKAVALANDLPRLISYRSALRQRMEQSPLMDAPRYARDVEAAYRQMWRMWCASRTDPASPDTRAG